MNKLVAVESQMTNVYAGRVQARFAAHEIFGNNICFRGLRFAKQISEWSNVVYQRGKEKHGRVLTHGENVLEKEERSVKYFHADVRSFLSQSKYIIFIKFSYYFLSITRRI